MWRSAFLILAIAVPKTAAADEANLRAADEKLLQEAGLKADGPALLDFFRKRTLSDADIAKLADTVRRLGDKSFTVREKATADLIAAGRSASPFLRIGLKDADLEVARRAQDCIRAIENSPGAMLAGAAARLLAVRQPPDATKVILGYLP